MKRDEKTTLKPSPDKMLERLMKRKPYTGKVAPSKVLREERDFQEVTSTRYRLSTRR